MSDILFPNARNKLRLRLRLALVASVIGAVFATGAVYLGLSYIGIVGSGTHVTVQLTMLGDSLGPNSSVKYHGLRIGHVVSVNATPDAHGLFSVKTLLEDGYARDVPAGLNSRVLPGTIFGADYIDLVQPSVGGAGGQAPHVDAGSSSAGSSSAGSITDGAVIAPDRSATAVEVMRSVSEASRLISAVNPQALDQAMAQLAGALDGRGADLRDAVARSEALFAAAQQNSGVFYSDLDSLSKLLTTGADIEPAVAQTLKDSIPTAQLISAKAQALGSSLKAGDRLVTDLSAFMTKNGPTLTTLLNNVAPVYGAFVNGTGSFNTMLSRTPGVLANGASITLGNRIQMYALFNSFSTVNPYTAADCPRYGAIRGANCP